MLSTPCTATTTLTCFDGEGRVCAPLTLSGKYNNPPHVGCALSDTVCLMALGSRARRRRTWRLWRRHKRVPAPSPPSPPSPLYLPPLPFMSSNVVWLWYNGPQLGQVERLRKEQLVYYCGCRVVCHLCCQRVRFQPHALLPTSAPRQIKDAVSNGSWATCVLVF